MTSTIVTKLQERNIRCILFDCGATLWTAADQMTWQRIERTANLAMIAILREQVTEEDFPIQDAMVLGKQIRTTIKELMGKAKLQYPGYEPDSTRATLETLSLLGFSKLTTEIGEAVFEALRIRIPSSRVLFPDALSTLATLQKRGFILGVVTNRHWGGAPFREDMRALGLFSYFDPACLAVSVDLGTRKPNPAIFMHALDALHVTPAEAVMVGDSLRADVAGARALDIFTVWKPKPSLLVEARATQAYTKEDLLDQHLFAYAREMAERHKNPLPANAQPDMTIEHLSELLDIFLNVRKL